MREIKFRTWDNKYKEYVIWEEFCNTPGTLGMLLTKKLTDTIIEQYTGLKDKNGKEIYEGDVVEHLDSRFSGFIVFSSGSFMCDSPENDEVLYGLENGNTEIIGNIHENPELLEASR